MSLWPASMAIFRGVQLSYRNTTCKYNIKMQNTQIETPFKPGATTTLSWLAGLEITVCHRILCTDSQLHQPKTQAVNYSKQIQTEVRNMLHLNKGVPSCNVKGILFYHTISALYIVNVVKIFRYILYVCK